MIDLTTLTAVFTLYEHNFRILHWGSTSKKFDRQHKIAAEYYERCGDDLDTIAEYAMRLDLYPTGYKETLTRLTADSSHNYPCIEYKEFEYDEFCDDCMAMITSILNALVEVHESEILNDPMNIGIKSGLESIIEYWDLQGRYLHKRRME